MKPYVARAVGLMQSDLKYCKLSSECQSGSEFRSRREQLRTSLDAVKNGARECDTASENARFSAQEEGLCIMLAKLEHARSISRKSRSAYVKLLQQDAYEYAKVLAGMSTLVKKDEELPAAKSPVVFAIVKRYLRTREMFEELGGILEVAEEEFGVNLYADRQKMLRQVGSYVRETEHCVYGKRYEG